MWCFAYMHVCVPSVCLVLAKEVTGSPELALKTPVSSYVGALSSRRF